MPGRFMEVDAAQVICPECSSSKPSSGSSSASALRAHLGVDNPSTNVPPTALSLSSLSASSSVHSLNRASPPILTEPLHAPRSIEAVKSTAAEMESEDCHWRADLDAGRRGSHRMGERRRRRPWGKPNEVPLAAVGTPGSATALKIEPSRLKEHIDSKACGRVSAQVPAASPLLHEADGNVEEGEGGLFGIVGADPAPRRRLHRGGLGRVVRWIKEGFARRDRVEWEVMDF